MVSFQSVTIWQEKTLQAQDISHSVYFIICKLVHVETDTNHMLLEARLVAGSKLTRDKSHPLASYKEGVSFPEKT